MDKRGADKFLSIYWFLILFLVAGAVVYIAFLFYGSPYNIRNAEGQILGDQIAGCLTNKGYLNNAVFTPEFKNNFLSACHINLDTEDFSSGKDSNQYYIGFEIYSFDESAPTLLGNKLLNLSAGDINLKTAWELTTPSKGFLGLNLNKRNVNTIVIHATESQDALGAIQTLSERGLNIHYMIDRDGTIYSVNNNPTPYKNAFVSEDNTAQHAGCIDPATNNERATCSVDCRDSNGLLKPACQAYSLPSSSSDCCIEGFNPKSIGIELVNIGDACTDIHFKDSAFCQGSVSLYGKQWERFSDAQINALTSLISDISSRYNLPLDQSHIIGHDQIANYKIDPGPQFPWSSLMQELNSRGAVSIASTLANSGNQQRSFYELDSSGNKYIVRILALVGKINKNE